MNKESMDEKQHTMKSRQQYDLEDLRYLMQRLRDPATGCPWDCRQSYETIVPYTLEEVYEVIDTIERGDFPHLKEELGDLLFQVVFYAQLAAEEKLFDLGDVVHAVVAKLVARHPHVFPLGTLESRRGESERQDEARIKDTWEQIKQEERNEKGRRGALADIPTALPALLRAGKVQKRAAKVGFDWDRYEPVLEKLQEEIAELMEAATVRDKGKIDEELGDIFFTCVNLARHLSVDSEGALRRAVNKFESRFERMEAAAGTEGKDLADLSAAELETLWEATKQQ